jgi:zinc-ribbon domain
VIYCRYCGAQILDDSVFCSKCGKRLGRPSYPRLSLVAQKLRLKTPYPYFALLLALYIGWTAAPRQAAADYSHLKWTFEQDRKMDLPDGSLFQQALSLVVENTGTTAVADIPVELSAKIEPAKPSEVVAGFLGRKLIILQQGRPLPLVIVLADTVAPGAKRRYSLEGSITAEPPFKVTYEVRGEDQDEVLASFVVEQ